MHSTNKNIVYGYRYLKKALQQKDNSGVYSISFSKYQSYGRTISSAIRLLKKMPEIKILMFLNIKHASTPLISHKKESVNAILDCGVKNRLRRPKVGKNIRNVFLRSVRKMLNYKKEPQKTYFKKIIAFEHENFDLRNFSNVLDNFMPKKTYFAPRELLEQSCQ